MAIHDKEKAADTKPAATIVDPFQAYISAFSAPGAGIDIGQFKQDFLPSVPEAPEATTARDPYNNALAVFGAGLAAPIGPDQTFHGNTAKAALAGLDVIGNARKDINAQAQVEFKNTLDATNLQADQGKTLVGAHQANLQRDYYTGLIKNAGLTSLLDANGDASEDLLKAAELAEKVFKTTVEFVQNLYTDEEIQVLYPAGMGAIYADILTMIRQGVGIDEAASTILATVEQQKAYLELKKRYTDLGIGNQLPTTVGEFQADQDYYVQLYKDAVFAKQNPPRISAEEASALPDVTAEGQDDPAVQAKAQQIMAMDRRIPFAEAMKMAFKQLYPDKASGGTN